MALFMANAGDPWDDAKKVHRGLTVERAARRTRPQSWATPVGDLFKDTSGPSPNILIQLMSVVSLVLAPLFLAFAPLAEPSLGD